MTIILSRRDLAKGRENLSFEEVGVFDFKISPETIDLAHKITFTDSFKVKVLKERA